MTRTRFLLFTFALVALPFPLLGQSPLSQDLLKELAALPVQHEGRIKPLQTFAEVHLLAFHGKRNLKDLKAMPWLMELLLNPEQADQRQVFDIRNFDVVSALGLEKRDQHKYSFNELFPALRSQMSFLQAAFAKDREDRGLVERQMLELYGNISRYVEIGKSLNFLQPAFTSELESVQQAFALNAGEQQSYLYFFDKKAVFADALDQMRLKSPEDYDRNDLEIVNLAKALEGTRSQATEDLLRLIPSPEKDHPWHPPWTLFDGHSLSPLEQAYLTFFRQLDTWQHQGNADELATSLAQLKSLLGTQETIQFQRLNLEVWKNNANLFVNSLAFYILSFLLLCFSWTGWTQLLRRLSFGALFIGTLLHLLGIILRMIIMQRPPVSTLYESIIFVGLISVLGGLILEWVRRSGSGLFLGTVLGMILHFVGFGYAADGDTMGMLVAVLNSNFWLATHVVTISIGYGAAFVAGLVGHLYLFFQIVQPQNKEKLQHLFRTMIGTSLVALFFSLFGTILGGIWADQSWGRFWGWDPKENGALLICLWLLALLHGRIAGILKECGIAFGLVINNIIVALAWFGVNLLNVGLHSYGFTDSIAFNLSLFCLVEVLLGGIGYVLAKGRQNSAMAQPSA